MLMQLHMMHKGNIGVHMVYMQMVYQADEVLLLGKFVFWAFVLALSA